MEKRILTTFQNDHDILNIDKTHRKQNITDKTKNIPISVIGKPIEKRFKDGAERVIMPILTLINNKITENGNMIIEAA